MNYKKKRLRSRLTPYTVSKELGIDYKKYLEVEKGNIPLEGDYVEKFNEIMLNAKMIRFNHIQKMKDVRDSLKTGELKELVAKRGYNGMTLSMALGIDGSTLSRVLNQKDNNENILEMVYDFLQDPINRNIEKLTKKQKISNIEDEDKVSSKEVQDLKKTIKENKISQLEICRETGIRSSNLYAMLKGEHKMKKSYYDKIIEFISNKFSNKEEIKKEEIKKIDSEKLKEEIIDRYGSIEDFSKKIDYGKATIYMWLKYDKYQKQRQKIIDFLNKEKLTDEIEDAELIKETSIENPQIIETPTNEKTTEYVSEVEQNYPDLLKENKDLKRQLFEANRQIMLYEILIERLQ